MSKRILLGVTEIAGAIDDYRQGYIKNNCRVTTLVRQQSPHFPHIRYNYIIENMLPAARTSVLALPWNLLRKLLNLLLRYTLLTWLCCRSDIFHVIWPANFVNWRYFLRFIRLIRPGLQILFNPVGDDIRWRRAFIQESEQMGLPVSAAFIERTRNEDIATLREKLELLRLFEANADLVCSHPSQAQMALRPYRHYAIPMQLEQIPEPAIQDGPPLIIHAATERAVKGTDLVLETIDQLQEEGYQFEFRLLERLSNSELLKLMAKADIVIYNPFSKGPGKFGLEALATGCLLLTGYRESYLPVPPDPPVVDVDAATLKERLRYFLQHPGEMQGLQKQGRKWVETWFETGAVCRILLNDLQKLQSGEEVNYDFYPAFFREHYLPVFGDEEAALHLTYRKEVVNTSWYRRYVQPGLRDKLIF